MGKTWDDDPEATYGNNSLMTPLIEVIRRGTRLDAVAVITGEYPHVPIWTVEALVIDTQNAYRQGDLVRGDTLVREFIRGPARPPDATPTGPMPWWRRLWQSEYAMGWLFGAFAAVALLTAVKVWA